MIRFSLKKKTYRTLEQLNLEIDRPFEPDRNHKVGGRSFYFFDFDDNVAFLPTQMFLFHKESHREVCLSTKEYAKYSGLIGKGGFFKDYYLNFDDKVGSYRRFRDQRINMMERIIKGKSQAFVEDVTTAIRRPEQFWKGPSWECFYHAVYNQRPVAIITARGHEPETIKQGISQFVKAGFLPCEPNYLGVYPVSNPKIRHMLGDIDLSLNVPELKKLSIEHAVNQSFKIYGKSPFHRFGMSDDDDKNVELVIEAMKSLKKDNPNNSFFVIHAKGSSYTKEEILLRSSGVKANRSTEQLSLL